MQKIIIKFNKKTNKNKNNKNNKLNDLISKITMHIHDLLLKIA